MGGILNFRDSTHHTVENSTVMEIQQLHPHYNI